MLVNRPVDQPDGIQSIRSSSYGERVGRRRLPSWTANLRVSCS